MSPKAQARRTAKVPAIMCVIQFDEPDGTNEDDLWGVMKMEFHYTGVFCSQGKPICGSFPQRLFQLSIAYPRDRILILDF